MPTIIFGPVCASPHVQTACRSVHSPALLLCFWWSYYSVIGQRPHLFSSKRLHFSTQTCQNVTQTLKQVPKWTNTLLYTPDKTPPACSFTGKQMHVCAVHPLIVLILTWGNALMLLFLPANKY